MKVKLKEGLIVEANSIESLDWSDWSFSIMEMVKECKDLISIGDAVFDGSKVVYHQHFLKAEIKDDMIIISGK